MDRVPGWLLFPCHPLGCYVVIRNYLAFLDAALPPRQEWAGGASTRPRRGTRLV